MVVTVVKEQLVKAIYRTLRLLSRVWLCSDRVTEEVASMSSGAGVDYIRVRLLECEPDDRLKDIDELFDPYVIIHIMEAETEPGQTSWFHFLADRTATQYDRLLA